MWCTLCLIKAQLDECKDRVVYHILIVSRYALTHKRLACEIFDLLGAKYLRQYDVCYRANAHLAPRLIVVVVLVDHQLVSLLDELVV